jgi:hypothetical protein
MLRQTDTPARLFERYVLDAEDERRRPATRLSPPSSISTTDVTNYLLWLGANSADVLEKLRELTATDEEFDAKPARC